MRLKVIIPNAGMDRATLDDRQVMLSRFARPDTEISVDCIDAGPESIESAYDEVLAAPEVLDGALRAQVDGYDALIVYCFSDPAVDAARELLSIPVIGPGEASIMSAAHLAHRFSILTVLDDTIMRHKIRVHRIGIPTWRLASVRSVGIPVSRLRDDLNWTLERLLPVATRCRDDDGAHAIILSCLGMATLGRPIQQALGIPVIDPAFISIAWAEWLVCLGLTHSRLSYPTPSEKQRLYR